MAEQKVIKMEDDDVEVGEEADEATKLMEQMEAEQQKQADLMKVSDLMFSLSLGPNDKPDVKEKLFAEITEKKMAPLLKIVCAKFGYPLDQALLSSMEQSNKEDLEKLDAKIVDAKENLGDMEVQTALQARADFLASIGEKDIAFTAYESALEKAVGAGARIDLLLAMLRLALMHGDMAQLRKLMDRASEQVEKGGDWERRNVFHIYRAVLHMMDKEYAAAAKILVDAVATFTAYQLFDFKHLVFYTVLTAVVSLDRVQLREKVAQSPDVLSIIGEVPHLQPFLSSLARCQYPELFPSLVGLGELIRQDPYLSHHTAHLLREIRIVAYTQFLEPYKSVTLASMSQQFGVGPEFLDRELSRFIVAGRLNAKIDRVSSIVETNRPDQRNAQYAALLKEGDALLSRIQKLSKLVAY